MVLRFRHQSSEGGWRMCQQALTCHQKYYKSCLPQLYQAALFLTGNPSEAERICGQLWTQACQECDCAMEQRQFLCRCFKALVRQIRESGIPQQELALDHAIGRALCGLTLIDRCLVVFSGLSCSLEELSEILGQPVWLLKGRLRQAMTGLRKSSLVTQPAS